jgi:3-hydroxybutyrate dehydrogenase
MQRFAGKVALVTGAGGGIGREIARAFAREGAHAAIADLDGDAAEAAAREINQAGGSALAVTMDVTREDAVDSGVATVARAFGGVDVLVSNAGIQIVAPLEEFAFADWRRLMAVHLDGAFLTTRACLREMYARGGGAIVYIGSVHSKEASRLKAPYVTAKHGLLGLTRVVAKEGASRNVRANVVCPGYVRTPLVERQIPEQAAKLGLTEAQVVRDVMLRDTVDGEFTTAADVAEAVLWLAGFPTKALTGQSLNVSHGWSMT